LKRNQVLFVLFFILATLTAFAEPQDTVKVINFRVVDAISGKPVELAHIINSTHGYASIADKLGYFKIPLFDGDTMSISSMGYYNQFLYCWGQYSYDSTFYIIHLRPRSYPLNEVKVTWFSNYDKFLKGVSDLRIPLTKEEESTIRITEYFRRAISRLDLKNLPSSGSGMLFGSDWLAKQSDDLVKRLEKERKRRAVERKYSAGIVSALTGLTGNEVHWFIDYCALTDEYILKTSDYDIRTKILDKFKIYSYDKTSKEKK
jgi:hypothetical protein